MKLPTLEQLQDEKRARLLAYLEAHHNLRFGVSAVKNRIGDCLRPKFTSTGARYGTTPFKGIQICEYLSESWKANPYDSLGRKVALLAFAAHEATQGFNDNVVSAASMVDFILQNETRLMQIVSEALNAFVDLEMCDEFIKATPLDLDTTLIELEVGNLP